MAKDEGDVIDHTLYHLAAEGVDGFIIADNMSEDDTRDRLLEAKTKIQAHYGVTVDIQEDREVAYTQGHKMTMLGQQAGAKGATWVIPFDVDELWFSQEGTLKEVFERAHKEGYKTIKPLYTNHSLTEFDPPGDCPYETMVYKWSTPTNHKAAYRYRDNVTISNGNHFVAHGSHQNRDEKPLFDVVEMRHFQYRSKEHFFRKILNAYKACKALPPNADLYGGAAWREQFIAYEERGMEGLEDYFYEKVFVSGDTGSLIYDPAPYKGGWAH